MFWRQLERRFSVGGIVSEHTLLAANGLPQGDPLSVLLTNCVVEGWARGLDHLPLQLCAFIDDRTVVTRDRDAMQQAWALTHEWDASVHWKMNVKKSALAIIGPHTSLALEHRGEVLPEVYTLKILGLEAITMRQAGGLPQAKRTKTGVATCMKIALLSLGFRVAKKLVQMSALPKWRYSLHMKPTPQDQVAAMKRGVKLALGLTGKLHSWWVVAGILNRPHQLDPLSYSMYVHVREFIRALRSSPTLQNLFIQSSEWRSGRVVRGPIMCLRHYAELCSVRIEGLSLEFGTRQVHLLRNEPKKIMELWQEALGERMRTGARQSRRAFDGLDKACLRTSVKSVNKKFSPWRRELVGLLSDAIWTRHRKKVAGLIDSDICEFCSLEAVEDISHVLHDCPRWQEQRRPIEQYAAVLRNAPNACQRCLFYLPELGIPSREWGRVQEGYASIVREWGQATRMQEKGEPLTPELPEAQSLLQEWPPVPTHVGQAIDFKVSYALNSTAGQWPSTRSQWHRACHFVTLLRIIPGGGFRCTLLELYLSYLVTNGMRRWESGVSNADRGDRISTQMERFRTAMLVFQQITGIIPLVPNSHDAERVGWGKRLGFRDLLLTPTPGVIPPRLGEARALLEAVPCLIAEGKQVFNEGTDIWRRWAPGIEHSQLDGEGGSLSDYPIVCSPVGRICKKAPLAMWQQQCFDHRKLMQRILRTPVGLAVGPGVIA